MAGSEIKVLLFEDNPADALLLEEALQQDPLNTFSLTTVERLMDGLAQLEQDDFGIILLDLNLPDSQGLATFERVYRQAPGAPVVVLTGNVDEQDAIRALQAGAQDYLVKGQAVWEMAPRAIRYAIERQQARLALRQSEERYRRTLDEMMEGCQIIDFDWRYVYINEAAAQQGRFTRAQMLGQTMLELYPGIEKTEMFAALRDCMENRAAHRLENNFSYTDGTSGFFELNIQPVAEGVFILSLDITERKQAEAALQVSEERHRHISGLISDYVYSGLAFPDGASKTEWVSGAFERITGYTFAEVNRLPGGFSSLLLPQDLEHVISQHPILLEQQSSTVEYRIRRKDGKICWLRDYMQVVFAAGLGEVARLIGAVQDITARKQAEEALTRTLNELQTHQIELQMQNEELRQAQEELDAAREKYFDLYELAPTGYMTIDAAGLILEANLTAANLLGVKKMALVKQPLTRFIFKEDQDINYLYHQQLLETGAAQAYELRIVRKDGALRWVRIEAKAAQGSDGAPVFWKTLSDITERKQAEEALRKSEEKYRGLMESLDSVVTTVDDDGRFQYMNDVAASQLGGAPADFIGKTMAELFPEPVAARQMADIRQVIRADQGCVLENQSIVRGQPRWYRTSIQPIHDETGRAVCALVNSTDIDDLKTAQQELLELNRTLEERVQERTAQVQDLYENAPTGYHSLDANSNFLLINQTELDWLGYSREEMIGRPFTDFCTAQSFSTFRQEYPGFKQRGWVKDLEFELIRKDGTTFPILVNGTAIYDDAGNYVMSRSTMVDLTARKKAEIALRESEEQNRLLFEESPEAVILFDEAGRVVRVNRTFEKMTGYSGEQLTDPTFAAMELLPRKQLEPLAAVIVQAIQSNDPFQTIEFKLQRADGEVRDVGARVFGLKIRDHQHYLTTIRDITTDKQAAAALHQANAELARAARAKDEFLANMSHELRTPLNAILGLSEALLEHVRGPLNERQQTSLRYIEASGRHLLALINDILDLSKVEAGQMEIQLETVPLAEICQASLLFVREMATRKSLLLSSHLDDQLAKVQVDPKRLKQMLVNLLSNAVKFTPAGGQVSLAVTTDAEAGVIRFAVQDSGIGIAPEDIARLFQPFTQLDSSLSRQYEGSGLGLALVRRLAELHGGTVAVESDGVPGLGSRFTLTLPYHRPEPLATSPSPAPPAEQPTDPGPVRPAPGVATAASARILLAEDNEANIRAINDYLQATGYQVVVARNGQEALDRAAESRPDLILMDIQMPQLDGLAAIRRLRAMPEFATTPIIALTALAMPGDRERCLEAGANEYLTKPVSLRGLTELIEQLLKP